MGPTGRASTQLVVIFIRVTVTGIIRIIIRRLLSVIRVRLGVIIITGIVILTDYCRSKPIA